MIGCHLCIPSRSGKPHIVIDQGHQRPADSIAEQHRNCAAACKSHITKYNAKWYKAHAAGLWSSGNVLCEVTNHASLFSMMGESEFGGCQDHYLPDLIVPNVKFMER